MTQDNDAFLTREIQITNKFGLHARAAARFVSVASRFHSEIRVKHGSKEVNGKSIMGLMMLAARCGTQLIILACGPDAEEALATLSDLINERFGEAE
ncbi:MAG TPA: HPr family phosphocarrier protein [Nitrococcus sp.]|nr:HPr family phosphocarrier protein [Nitrococcus sp.]